jgi:hypothetical protein
MLKLMRRRVSSGQLCQSLSTRARLRNELEDLSRTDVFPLPLRVLLASETCGSKSAFWGNDIDLGEHWGSQGCSPSLTEMISWSDVSGFLLPLFCQSISDAAYMYLSETKPNGSQSEAPRGSSKAEMIWFEIPQTMHGNGAKKRAR